MDIDSASDFLRDSAEQGVGRAMEDVGGDDFGDLDEVISDIVDFDLPEIDDETAGVVDEGVQSQATTKSDPAPISLEEKYNAALDELARLKGQTPVKAAEPVDTEAEQKRAAAARRAVYDKYKSTRDLNDEEIAVMEDRLAAYMEATGQTHTTKQVEFLTQVVESMYLENEKMRLQKTFDNETVDKYYDSAMRLVAAGKVQTIEDGILLLDARTRRSSAGSAQRTVPPSESVTQKRQAAASQHAPRPQSKPVTTPNPQDAGKAGAKDYLRAVLRNRLSG